MLIANIVGARPQFVKCAVVVKALEERGQEALLVHTGQHYDRAMSDVFFEQLEMRAPDANLGVGSGPAGAQIARMLTGLEELLLDRRPDWVVVYGDTNTTLAGALAACKTGMRLAHVEAGLRSFNRSMPEEHNRVLTDHCSDLLLCPTPGAAANLDREGITRGVHLVGDTMCDAVHRFASVARRRSAVLESLGLRPGRYLLATVHRAGNTDHVENLRSLLDAFGSLEETVVLPLHPRTGHVLQSNGMGASALRIAPNVRLVPPAGYLDMLALEENARLILTDSGGVQKEAYLLGVPCVTLREETEWVETVREGWNVLAGSDPRRIRDAVARRDWPSARADLFGDGQASSRIAALLTGETPTSFPHQEAHITQC
ncbi:MAG: UDP-N-acetylglucosamine 2-epimerase (non-hydrolyzing) [Bryobacterales bacterium]|nr:UDP-N-acetylglucosamine 2-epimerase (non-hydrolyzing) [Bryobacterales bacterium]